MSEQNKKPSAFENIKEISRKINSGEIDNLYNATKTQKDKLFAIQSTIKTVSLKFKEENLLKENAAKLDSVEATVSPVNEKVAESQNVEVVADNAPKAVPVVKEKKVVAEVTAEVKTPVVAQEVTAKEVKAPKADNDVVTEKAPKDVKAPKVEKVEKPAEEVAATASTAEPVIEIKKNTIVFNGREYTREELLILKEKEEAFKIAQKAALERASAKALEIENRLKQFYNENGRESSNNRPQQSNGAYQGRQGTQNGTYVPRQQNGQGQPGGYNRPYQGNNNNSTQNGASTGYIRQPRLGPDGKPLPYQPRPYNNNTSQGGYGARPFNPNDKDADLNANPQRRAAAPKKPGGMDGMPVYQKPDTYKPAPARKKDKPSDSDNKVLNKRALIKRGFVIADDGDYEDRMGTKKIRPRKAKEKEEIIFRNAPIVIEKAIVNTEMIPIKVLSEKLGKTVSELIKKLFADNIIKTVNDSLDFGTAEYLASNYNITLELKLEKTAEDILVETQIEEEDDDCMVTRPPIVTIMGHVDHGKTSLLDAIRQANVTNSEAGGITQHIGAYSVEISGKKITFLDTPGHEAFTAMRKRGALITDIAILVVAADDGIMPQTIEAINHIKAAGVTLMVAINKMDKEQADKTKVLQQLTQYEILTEEWGGEVVAVPVSAVTKEGIEELLESILLVADVKELKANPNKKCKGTVVEAQLDKGRGPVATVLVQNGTLKVGDTVLSGFSTGKIRAMFDDKGNPIKSAGPSTPVSILGLSEVPHVGDVIIALDSDKLSKQVISERIAEARKGMTQDAQKVTLEDAFSKITEGQLKSINVIIKGDVQGSVEALKQSLEKIANEEVKVRVLHGAVGGVTESDIMLASTSSAVIIGFNVRPDAKSKNLAEKEGVEIKTYRVIYDAIEDIEAAAKGMLTPIVREITLGNIEVRDVFKITGVGAVAGGYVTGGKVVRHAKVRIARDGIVIFEGEISSLKRFKDDVKEVAQGFECGMVVSNYNDIKVGDILEAFLLEEVKRD